MVKKVAEAFNAPYSMDAIDLLDSVKDNDWSPDNVVRIMQYQALHGMGGMAHGPNEGIGAWQMGNNSSITRPAFVMLICRTLEARLLLWEGLVATLGSGLMPIPSVHALPPIQGEVLAEVTTSPSGEKNNSNNITKLKRSLSDTIAEFNALQHGRQSEVLLCKGCKCLIVPPSSSSEEEDVG